jgi:RHS repeat-associated protein
MAYQPDGLRVKKETGTGTTKFVWDGEAYLLETDGADATAVVYTNEPQQYGSLVSQRRGSTSSFYHFEALGSTRDLTASNGATSDTFLYDAFGSLVTSSGSTVNPFRFVGQLGYYYDSETVNTYVRARHYRPHLGIWMTMDPLGFPNLFASGVGLWADPNLYRYVGNDSVFFVDPSGYVVYTGQEDKEDTECPGVPRMLDPRRQCSLIGPAVHSEVMSLRIVKDADGDELLTVEVQNSFTVADPAACSIIQWRYGHGGAAHTSAYGKGGTGRAMFHTPVNQYGRFDILNTSNFQWVVDSRDRDPEWGSDPGRAGRYVRAGTTIASNDRPRQLLPKPPLPLRPGLAHTFFVYVAVAFKACLYNRRRFKNVSTVTEAPRPYPGQPDIVKMFGAQAVLATQDANREIDFERAAIKRL